MLDKKWATNAPYVHVRIAILV